MRSQRRMHAWVWGALGVALGAAGVVVFLSMSEPSDTGALITDENAPRLQVPLEETEELRTEIVAELASYKDDNRRPTYEAWIDRVGANGLIAATEAENPLCHDEGHDLGKVIYAELQDVGYALRTCEDACASGCMHGVLMEAFALGPAGAEGDGNAEHLELEDIKSQMADVCGDSDQSGDATMGELYLPGDCAHGVGHALMFLSDYTPARATEYCSFFDSDPMDYYCATGAYMEYTSQRDELDLSDGKSLYYPCDEVEYPAACFRYKAVHVVRRAYDQELTFGDIVNTCVDFEGKYRLACFHGIGNAHLSIYRSGQATIEMICSQGTEEDQYACIDGAIERMAKYYPDEAAAQCLEFSPGWKMDLCYEGVERGMYDLEKDFSLYPR